jgi:regulator of protease activity HflC (stomatin/prohibitin superfamily)
MWNVVMVLVVLFLFIMFFSLIRSCFVWIRPFQKGLHERFGKFKGVLDPGFYYFPLIWPWVDRVTLMDLREGYTEIPPAKVITKDNVVLEVDAVIFYQIVDPARALYEVANIGGAILNLAEPGLRNIVGTLTVDEALVSREVINTKLRDDMDKYSDKWGTKVTKVEVKRVDPPRDIQEAMHRQKTAEQLKRAMILEAEGKRNSTIAVAEGDKQSAILKAEGEMTAKMRVADGEKYSQIAVAEGRAQAILNVLNSIHEGKMDSGIASYLYLTEALPKVFQSMSNKWIMTFDLPKLLESGNALAPAALGGLLGYDFGKTPRAQKPDEPAMPAAAPAALHPAAPEHPGAESSAEVLARLNEEALSPPPEGGARDSVSGNCIYCGTKMRSGSRFCPKCGHQIPGAGQKL